MIEIIGVRFKSNGKVYYFSPDGKQFQIGDLVIVETAKGIECGEVTIPNKTIQKAEVVQPLKQILRAVNKDDLRILEQNRKKEIRAFHICEEKIAMRKLEMKLIEVECAFDNSKLLFYFTAENRVDFRDLVKDLAAIFRTRIELRQIGVRDKAKILGGIGICGREFCCKGFLCEFQPVSIKMAKEQGLSLNPAKISGCCGRLMCCLKHEQSVYEELLKITPKLNATVALEDGTKGKVVESNPLTGDLKIQTEQSEVPVKCNRKDVTLLKDGKIRVNPEERNAFKELEGK
ncbi:MAG: stage 0 sporulation family protein [Oscillospiraceae bacterium]|nr:stage 0 sporulation family protein [Oscillospiraceae bacterium]